ncbi:hypothetical protein CU254_14725 [Amycolatopsis sp. AA4]|uniref:hypothetical protein n=1 Tax=Actinomycetes TaxID=1760 RepID=UPI0001B54ADC|nr:MULTISPECIES: hypothetical protein [Actinomycetes]ATY11572.1 hypothetical protein CU254_14725 [Amycolatopsis sp. AA4]EFL07215.1 predicted protein [Streptomyces sp. AA4]
MPDRDNEIDLSTLEEPVRAYIKELRGENAKHRAAKNTVAAERDELAKKYEEAGQLLQSANERLTQFDAFKEKATKLDALTDDHEKLLTENSVLGDKLTRLEAAAKFGIADEADRIKGTTKEELEKDAEALAKRLGGRGLPMNPAAGFTPPPPNEDPLVQALRDAVGG